MAGVYPLRSFFQVFAIYKRERTELAFFQNFFPLFSLSLSFMKPLIINEKMTLIIRKIITVKFLDDNDGIIAYTV